MNPVSLFKLSITLLGISLPLITFKGKNVARPSPCSFKYLIASLAHDSLSTTIKLLEAPIVTSIAFK